MEYTLRSGILYQEPSHLPLRKIDSSMIGPVKKIYTDRDILLLKADIAYLHEGTARLGDLHDKVYRLVGRDEEPIATGRPGYAEGEDPDMAGWPVSRLPRVDHAKVTIAEAAYRLTMHNSQDYSLRDGNGREVMRILHKGICGGWRIRDDYGSAPELLCGIFIFCRYIEQENEFLIV